MFVTCGMGGGTGTGAAPIIAQIAKDVGALTVGIVTKPFLFEGRKRMRQAEMGITELRRNVDTMIVVPNERLLAVVGKGIPFQDALKKADEVLLNATRGISSLITSTGMINVDFADVRTVMQNGGAALMGTGIGRGENRALEAAQQAISSPLLDNVSIQGASGVLINIIGGDDLTLGEATQISEIIHDAVGRRRRDHLRRGERPPADRRDPGHGHRDRVRPGGHRRAGGGAGDAPGVTLYAAAGGGTLPPAAAAAPAPAAPSRPVQQPFVRRAPAPGRPAAPDVSDLEIPTFIRRQMD